MHCYHLIYLTSFQLVGSSAFVPKSFQQGTTFAHMVGAPPFPPRLIKHYSHSHHNDQSHSILRSSSSSNHQETDENIVNRSMDDDRSMITGSNQNRRQFLRRLVTTTTAAVVVNTAYNDIMGENAGLAKADDDVQLMESKINDMGPKGEQFEERLNLKDEKISPMDSSATTISNGSTFDARYFIAGGGCASISHGIATPFDVVKTRIQTATDTVVDVSNNDDENNSNDNKKGFVQTALSIIENEGPNALLIGLTPTIVGFGLEGAVKFGVYESLKPICMSLLHSDEKTIPYLLASIGAGAVASTMLCPMERARIRMVTQDKDDDTTYGLFGGIGPMIEEEGLSSILFGYPFMLFKQVPYTITKQCSFDLFASSISIYAMSILNAWPTPEVRLLSTVSAAFIASILACTMSQPGDVILTKKFNSGSDDSILKIAKDVYDEKGFGGFYAGYDARLAHVAAIVTSQLVLYDFLKQLLGLPATISA